MTAGGSQCGLHDLDFEIHEIGRVTVCSLVRFILSEINNTKLSEDFGIPGENYIINDDVIQ